LLADAIKAKLVLVAERPVLKPDFASRGELGISTALSAMSLSRIGGALVASIAIRIQAVSVIDAGVLSTTVTSPTFPIFDAGAIRSSVVMQPASSNATSKIHFSFLVLLRHGVSTSV
jgi:hypothetical protein